MRRSNLRAVSPLPEESADSQADDLVSAADVQAVELEYLLPGRLLSSSLSIVEGDSNAGKSTFLSALAAAVSGGDPFLGRAVRPRRDVLWLTSEEDPGAMIRPRLELCHADLSRIHFPRRDQCGNLPRYSLPNSCRKIHELVDKYQLALIVIDPLVSFLSEGIGINEEGPVRGALDPLAATCMVTGCSVVLVRHLKKDRSGPRITHGLGSTAIATAARSILAIDRPDPTEELRILRVIKSPGGPSAPSLSYILDFSGGPPAITGLRSLSTTEDDPSGLLVDAGERCVRDDARALLLSLLATEWVRKTTIRRLAEDAGIGERTLWVVKAELKIGSRRTGYGADGYSEWGPPGTLAPPPPPPVQTMPVQTMDEAKKPPKKRRNKRPSP